MMALKTLNMQGKQWQDHIMISYSEGMVGQLSLRLPLMVEGSAASQK